MHITKRILALLLASAAALALLPAAANADYDPVGQSLYGINCAYLEQGGAESVSNFLTTADLASHKLTLINIWSNGCGPCISEMPYLQQLHEEYADLGVLVVGGVTTWISGNFADEYTYLQQNGYTYINVIPDVLLRTLYYHSSYVPQTFLVNSTGQVIDFIGGAVSSYAALTQKVDYWLNVIDNDWQCTLTFIDSLTDAIIAQQVVPVGSEIVYPTAPVHEGYTFDKWTPENVTTAVEDTVFYANYVINKYRVRFYDSITGEKLKQQYVSYGSSATAPVPPEHEGYTFVGWDRDFSCITSAIDVYTVYSGGIHTLTINYVYEDCSLAAPPFVAAFEYGTEYSVTSPEIEGYTPDIYVVEGIMGNEDICVIVAYTANVYTLTIFYIYDNGAQAAVSYTALLEYGTSYFVPSPMIFGYTPNTEIVEGVMADNDVYLVVIYHANHHDLTIFYVYADGEEAFDIYNSSFEYGDSYSVSSPWIGGYAPDIPVVEGVMKDEDVNVTVTYTVTYTLTINYVFANGEQAYEPYTAQLAYGTEYTVPSPEIAGYTPDVPVVAGFMGNADQNVTVTYSINRHSLQINYVFADGSEAAPTYTAELAYGTEYSVPSPEITGFTPNTETVEGVMGDADVNVTVTYSINRHSLQINYVFADCSPAAETYSAELAYGTEYSVASPVITGYAPDTETVVGTMGDEDVTVTVTYTACVYTLTINYVFADGSTAAETYTAELAYDEHYRVISPIILSYTADRPMVAGNMPDHDLTVRVVYLNDDACILTIRYVYEDNSEAHETYYKEFFESDENRLYSVASPIIPGYKPDTAVVEGDMPDHNVNVTVTYHEDTSDILLGDVNGDGQVTANDALLILRYSLGLIESNNQLEAAGDVNGDGNVNANDALMVLRYALGVITHF